MSLLSCFVWFSNGRAPNPATKLEVDHRVRAMRPEPAQPRDTNEEKADQPVLYAEKPIVRQQRREEADPVLPELAAKEGLDSGKSGDRSGPGTDAPLHHDAVGIR